MLTAAETRMVVEHGITIGSKPLGDHLEAVGHFEALHYARDLVQRSDPDAAGRYADQCRYVETDSGRHHFLSPAGVAALMGDFAQRLGVAPPPRKLHLRRTAALSKSIRPMTAAAAPHAF